MPVGIGNSNTVGGKKIIKKISKPVAKPVAKPKAKPKAKPVAKPMVKPAAKPKKGGNPEENAKFLDFSYIEKDYTEIQDLYKEFKKKLQTKQNTEKIDYMYFGAVIIKSFLDDLKKLLSFCVNGGDNIPNKDENFLQKWKKIENKFFYNSDGTPKKDDYELLTMSLRKKLRDILSDLKNDDKNIVGIDKLLIYKELFAEYTNNDKRLIILNLIKINIYNDGMLEIKNFFNNLIKEEVTSTTESDDKNIQVNNNLIKEEVTSTTESDDENIQVNNNLKEKVSRLRLLKPLPPRSNEVVSDEDFMGGRGGAKKKKGSKVVAKRTPTPYNKFVKKHFPELKKKFPNDKAPEIMKKIAIEWKKTKK